MKDTKHIRRVILFCRLGHALGVGLGGTKAPKSNTVLLSVRYAISSLTIARNYNQIWYVSNSHEWVAQRKMFFFAPPPGALGRSQKVK